MPTKPYDPDKTNALPVEYTGKWIAWNSDHTRVVAHADELQELWQMVQHRDIHDPIFEKVPRTDVLFVGMQ
ncbi:MAG: DUF5678 domain-containing protein [Planctomycetota bacterium]|nr:DUF5678 domain-containing protein [Planctomycetota bacterium]